nr:hypothetical protein [Tanacetum cinerariifolium]
LNDLIGRCLRLCEETHLDSLFRLMDVSIEFHQFIEDVRIAQGACAPDLPCSRGALFEQKLVC